MIKTRMLVSRLVTDLSRAIDLPETVLMKILLILLIIITSMWAPTEIIIINKIRPRIVSLLINSLTDGIEIINKLTINSII